MRPPKSKNRLCSKTSAYQRQETKGAHLHTSQQFSSNDKLCFKKKKKNNNNNKNSMQSMTCRLHPMSNYHPPVKKKKNHEKKTHIGKKKPCSFCIRNEPLMSVCQMSPCRGRGGEGRKILCTPPHPFLFGYPQI